MSIMTPSPFVAYCDIEDIFSVEWHHGKHQLHIEINEDGDTTYTKVWGIKIDSQMEVQPFKPSEFPKLWNWLLEGESS
tara:strand:- start:8835 stop:9068 length:234 start_codon:yes stop_codon:yes gene_type:complete